MVPIRAGHRDSRHPQTRASAGTFFIIGKNGQAYPDLLRRIVNEGHELGNHTFTHPNLGEMPLSRDGAGAERDAAVDRIGTGRSTVLFRPPYFGDAEADKPQEVEPALVAQNLGYIMVGCASIRTTGNCQLRRIRSSIERFARHGFDPETRGESDPATRFGRRSFTRRCEALPTLIHELKARGFRFVAVSDLAGSRAIR
jgi:peptidoglycan/xylan/chitin deacetylase (PgdA/CDA1 family)